MQRTVHMLFDPALATAIPRGASVHLNHNDKEMAKARSSCWIPRGSFTDPERTPRTSSLAHRCGAATATFWMRERGCYVERQLPARRVALSPSPAPQIFPLRILCADDAPMNQKVAKAVLGHFGYVPEIVDDGAKAVEAALLNQYDLVLMVRNIRVRGVSRGI
jgi:CheY-like chemotaxis protein